MTTNSVYLVICEGDSEIAYVQELNRFLNEQGCRVVLQTVNAGGGGFSSVRQCCRDRKTRRNGRTFVMADRDIYFRNDNGCGEALEQDKDLLPPFLFQSWNFEDFLLMHFPAELVGEWRKLSRINGHLRDPKCANDYRPIYDEFCRNHAEVLGYDLPYEKGDMPFELSTRHMENLMKNSSDEFPKSDFAKMIVEVARMKKS